MRWQNILTLRILPQSRDAALLVMRVGFGLSLFLKHGFEKLTGYSHMVSHFPNPLGIGPHAGLAYALLADGICSVLVMLGLATRWAALVIVVNLAVVFTLVHHMAFFGSGHVELVVVYLVGFLAILIAGPGHYSLDGRIDESVQ